MEALVIWILMMIAASIAVTGASHDRYGNGPVVACECMLLFLVLLPFVSNILLK